MEDCGLASFVKLALQNSLGATILLQCTLTGQPMSLTTWGVNDHVLLLTIPIQKLGFGMRLIVPLGMDLSAEYEKVFSRSDYNVLIPLSKFAQQNTNEIKILEVVVK